jgi:cell division protein FtsI (penicillin-binding protein 3)
VIERLRSLWSRRSNKRNSSVGEPVADWRRTMRSRLTVASVLLLLWALGIEARLVTLQVVQHEALVERAGRQQMQTRPLAAKRGDILDRNGKVLATSVDADTIYAVPSAIGDESATVARLCSVFGDCTRNERADLIGRLRRNRNFAYIRRQVPRAVGEKIAALDLDGIGFIKESHREYPNAELAAHVLGFVGVDNKGLNGIESAYDSYIRGDDGQILVQVDAHRRAFNRFERPPSAGSTVELTIDEYLQYVVEEALRVGVTENRAQAGTAVVMDPTTGEVLALANYPTFNPNDYRAAPALARRNRAVQDLYEPGSTFKVVTASAAIEEKLMPVNQIIDVSGGRINIGARVVRDTHDYGQLSFTDVIVKSSNVGAIRIGFRLGTDRFSDYVQRFGFGRPVSPDFPSESPGIVWDRAKWTESALASVSMGYQVGVTPLQMAAAFSAIANGGNYLEPRVLRAVYRDNRRVAVKPRVLRRVVSADTAAAMTAIMEQVVDRGTATLAKIEGYTIAGKTGTANKLVNGRYSSDTYASFAGFLPSNNPAFTILVMIDAPRGNNGHFGGPVAAPIFKRVAEAALRYARIPPNVNPETPVLVAQEHPSPSHQAPTRVSVPEEGPLVEHLAVDEPGTVPNVVGMSLREAVQKLARFKVQAHVEGDGFVTRQDPPPGTPVADATVCRLTLQRTPVRQTAAVVLR